MDQKDKPESDPLFLATKRSLDKREDEHKKTVTHDTYKRIHGLHIVACADVTIDLDRMLTADESAKIKSLCASHDATIQAFNAMNTMMMLIGPEKTKAHIKYLLDQAGLLEKNDRGELDSETRH